jgi:glycosyltransferase involved in cell wall biosynthesis
VTGAPAPEVAPAKPRLLVLTSTFPRWAGDREPPFVYELSRRLAGQFEVHVLAPHAAGAQRAETLDGTHVHRFRYAPERLQQLAYDGGILARLRERRWRWLLVPCLVAVLAGATRHAPMLCTSHGGDLFGLRGRILGRLKRYVLSRCAAVTVVSEAMREEVQRLNPGQGVDVIPMGTDLTERFTPSRAVAREAGGVLFAGRLVEKKGVRHLLDAIARLHGQGRALTLRIAGSGPDLDMLRDEARRLGIVDRVEFLGSVDHARLAVLFRAATAAVVPSVVASDGDQEGFGLVIVEAMGCGCPVIASRLPAIGDIATDGETAMLVPPADPDALARAIAAVLDDPHGAEKRATAARARVVELFDWAVISRRYADLLGQLVGRPRPGSGH